MSRFRRTTARARQLWIGLRLNPQAGRARALRGDDAPGDRDAEDADDLPPEDDDIDDGPPEHRYVPLSLTVGASWSWRLLVIAAAVVAVFWALSQVTVVVIPVAISFLLAAMFQPVSAWLIRHGWNKSLASLLVLIGGLGVVVAVVYFVVVQFIAGIPDFSDQVTQGLSDARDWLETGPLGLDDQFVANALDDAEGNIVDWLQNNQEMLVQNGLSIAGSTASGLGNFFTGLFLVLFTTYFFMRDGRKIWQFLTGMIPAAGRGPMRYAGSAGWSTLVQYMRTMIIVAAVDAIAIGFGLWLLDIPLWLPLTTLIFLGAFVPIVGATVSGIVAVVVALVGTDNGLVNALIVLGIVLLVQQLESNLLQPVLMSRAVKLHPLAIVLAVTGGGFTFGIIGALVAVPLLAIVNGTMRALHHYRLRQREIEAEETAEDSGGAPSKDGEETVEQR
ncbi:AI-2E family transporter [Glycomyces arizonensis]|uniref:AI-2E family transporter n=1 Tax=Glycomyces arizonensis TaxID=256035 RepID=UPI0004238279|nr:AI-2E family transporter [Glycomyces arizonensis]